LSTFKGSPAFKELALKHLAKIIAGRYLDEYKDGSTNEANVRDFFMRAGLEASSLEDCTESGIYTRLLQLQLSGIAKQAHDWSKPQANGVINVIEQLCDPEEYFDTPDYQHTIIYKVNQVLVHYQLTVKQNGKLVATNDTETPHLSVSEEAKLFDLRTLHSEVRKHGRLHFIEGRYLGAVFECCKAFDKYVSRKSTTKENGTKLMQAVLSPNTNKGLRLNALQSETEKNEQLGLMHLCTGLMFMARNPGGHEPQLDYPLDKEDALDLLTLISFLYEPGP